MTGKNAVESICNDLGINQKKLAEIVGVSSNSVSTWKNNETIPVWVINMFDLLRIKKDCEEYKKVVKEIIR